MINVKKFKIGEKIALIGGGTLSNTFQVVIFKGYKKDEKGNTCAVLTQKHWDKIETFEPYVTEKVKPLPMMGSTWSLAKLSRQLKDLPLGEYAINGKEVRDITHMGYFGNIFNAKIVKTLK